MYQPKTTGDSIFIAPFSGIYARGQVEGKCILCPKGEMNGYHIVLVHIQILYGAERANSKLLVIPSSLFPPFVCMARGLMKEKIILVQRMRW